MTTYEDVNKTIKQMAEEFNNMHAIAIKVKTERDAYREALEEVRELIDGYVDVIDGDYGQPAANKAMRAVQLIDEALGSKP